MERIVRRPPGMRCLFIAKFRNSLDRNEPSRLLLKRSLHLRAISCGVSKSLKLNDKQPVIGKEAYGDDACFIVNNKAAAIEAVGVADGVGSWREYGVDPSLFPRNLMNNCKRYVLDKSKCHNYASPVTILEAAHESLKSERPKLLGSSTACILVLDKQTKTLHTANLGDSGFLIFRNKVIVHRSEEMQHSFNAPFQLSCHEKLSGSDRPSDAIASSFSIEEDDIILTATDGFFDNLSESQILHNMNDCNIGLKDHTLESLSETATNLVAIARQLSFDLSYKSPFEERAQSKGLRYKGGKVDDITIVIASVREVIRTK